MSALLAAVAGVVIGVLACVAIGRVLIRRVAAPMVPEVSRENAKLQMGENAVAVLNPGTPGMRRTMSQPPES